MAAPDLPGDVNTLLGYPRGARLLLVNADDLGMYPEVNAGVVRAAAAGIVRSTSLMVPCPGAPEAMRWLAGHPELPFGVHLTLVCDLPGLRWGPVSPPEAVPSLVDDAGGFLPLAAMAEWLPRVPREEVEREFRAQLAAVHAAGLAPDHLDWHCTLSGGRLDLFELTVALARAHGLAVRVADPAVDALARARGLPAADHPLLDSFDLPIAGRAERYAELLRELPPGLSVWAVHPGDCADAAARAIDPDGWAVRSGDLAFFASPQATALVRAEGIVLLGHRDLRPLWQGLRAEEADGGVI